jgi:hypothetical protein
MSHPELLVTLCPRPRSSTSSKSLVRRDSLQSPTASPRGSASPVLQTCRLCSKRLAATPPSCAMRSLARHQANAARAAFRLPRTATTPGSAVLARSATRQMSALPMLPWSEAPSASPPPAQWPPFERLSAPPASTPPTRAWNRPG